MGEPADTGTDSRVRDYIHGEICDQVERWANQALADGEPKFAAYIRQSWQGRLAALYEGRAVLVSRYELPDDHPENPKYGGDPADHFELTADDRLVPYDGPAPKLRLNRAARRAAGQRGRRLNGDGPVGR